MAGAFDTLRGVSDSTFAAAFLLFGPGSFLSLVGGGETGLATEAGVVLKSSCALDVETPVDPASTLADLMAFDPVDGCLSTVSGTLDFEFAGIVFTVS